jgi:hypothetical protein
MFNWGRIVEEQIRDAQQKGEFNNLAGEGKPLVTNDEETALEGDLKMAHHILKNADALPLWIEINKEIATQHEFCRNLLARIAALPSSSRRRKLVADYRTAAKALNDRILHFNCICPAPHLLAKAPVDIEANLARLTTAP